MYPTLRAGNLSARLMRGANMIMTFSEDGLYHDLGYVDRWIPHTLVGAWFGLPAAFYVGF